MLSASLNKTFSSFLYFDEYTFFLSSGPDTWSKHFKHAAGSKQSPIDIKPSDATFDPELEKNPLVTNYQTESELEISNTGQSFRVGIREKSSKSLTILICCFNLCGVCVSLCNLPRAV